MNGGVHLAHRLLVYGFEHAPFLLEPRNPRWYPALFEAAGFAVVHRWKTWEIERNAFTPLRDRMLALGRRGGRGTRLDWLDTAGDPQGCLARVRSCSTWRGPATSAGLPSPSPSWAPPSARSCRSCPATTWRCWWSAPGAT